jgi:large subunit ribosomal protein L10
VAKPEKQEQVRTLVDLLRRSDSLVLTDYRGLTVKQMTALRGRLAEVAADYHVSKNTLTKRALAEAGKPALDAYLEGPTAIAYSLGEPTDMARVLAAFARETKMLELKGGLLGGKVIDPAQVEALATLPRREVLLGMLVGTLQGPISSLVGTLQMMTAGLVMTLQAVADQKAGAGAQA